MPKAKSQENKENAAATEAKTQETADYKLEEGKGEDEESEESDESDEENEGDQQQPVIK